MLQMKKLLECYNSSKKFKSTSLKLLVNKLIRITLVYQ